MTDATPHAALINGKLYGYGATLAAAQLDFAMQISGAGRAMQNRMLARVDMVALTDEDASEVAEMLDAPILEWN